MRLFSWKMGRVAGIDLYIHATFLLVFLFVPQVRAGGVEAVEAILLVCAVFGCVLLHELGHALMARRFGIGTVDITLYPIGGVARLQRMPRAPGAELLIALAGPAVNFAIAGVIVALLSVSAAAFGLVGGINAFLGELLLVNLILGLFNLIPAFPMDGGRVLRALLSTAMGRARATRVASIVGQVLAVAFVVWSMTSPNRNPVHIALGAAIFFLARGEEASVRYEERRRAVAQAAAQGGMWVAPPGYRWVDRGNGLWQLAPIVGAYHEPAARDSASWN
jgi:Zn-dependent protease